MTNTCVLDLLENPPLELLKSHMSDVLKCVTFLPVLFEAVADENWQLAETIYQDVVSSEHSADEKKASFRKLLRKDLILQVPKADMLRIVHEQDKIANIARDIAGLVLWRRTSFPDTLRLTLPQYAKSIVTTCDYANFCLESFADLVESLFSRDGIKKLDENLLLLEQSESVCDGLECELRSQLILQESNYSAVQMICFYDIIHAIGSLADMAKSYGHFLFVCVSD